MTASPAPPSDGLVEAVLGMSTGLRDDFTPEQRRTVGTTTPTTPTAWAHGHLRGLLCAAATVRRARVAEQHGPKTAKRRSREYRMDGRSTGTDRGERPVGRRTILSGSTFEEEIGYARAVVVGDRVFVSGTTGFDYATMTISPDVVAQVEQALRNVEAALVEAGCGFGDVVRVRYLLPDPGDFEACWPALRAAFGEVRPAATMQVCGLSDPRMRFEIEVDAVMRTGARP